MSKNFYKKYYFIVDFFQSNRTLFKKLRKIPEINVNNFHKKGKQRKT